MSESPKSAKPPRPPKAPPVPRGTPGAYSDIDALGRHVEGFDARHYFDQQDAVQTRAAAQRWPLLGRALGHATDAADDPAPRPGG
ncbi:BcsR/BcsP family cellulose biosynthesis protein [Cupriavidus sp. 2KB_3]|uniref:BcsR/BcsP family cellulose biosynthesis protein n=1 Tax=Cupriavidus TaxID=106589 RepID=UPI0021CCBC45|nr:BcsR/BcsP family cellulose biosynthesis protein [Cupriavidus campinensis]